MGEHWVVLAVNLAGMPLNYSPYPMQTKTRNHIVLKILFSPKPWQNAVSLSHWAHQTVHWDCYSSTQKFSPKNSDLGITKSMDNIWTPERHHVDIFTPISMPEEFLVLYQNPLRWHFCCTCTTSCQACPPLVHVAPVTVILITCNSNNGL